MLKWFKRKRKQSEVDPFHLLNENGDLKKVFPEGAIKGTAGAGKAGRINQVTIRSDSSQLEKTFKKCKGGPAPTNGPYGHFTGKI